MKTSDQKKVLNHIIQMNDDLSKVRDLDINAYRRFKSEGIMYLRNFFGENHRYFQSFISIDFEPNSYVPELLSDEEHYFCWQEGKNRMIILLETIYKEIEEFGFKKKEIDWAKITITVIALVSIWAFSALFINSYATGDNFWQKVVNFWPFLSVPTFITIAVLRLAFGRERVSSALNKLDPRK